jgi:type II secretory pathway pseudopilin PulG
MELVVVIFIFSLVAAVVIPRLPSTSPGELRGAARKLAGTLRYLEDLSITEKATYRMHLVPETDSLTVKKLLSDGTEVDVADPFLQKRIIPADVVIADVTTQQGGKRSEGEAVIGFGVSGIDRYAVIHLKGRDGGFFTVTAYPVSEKVTIDEGYREEAP